MKYFLLMILALAVWWWWRKNKGGNESKAAFRERPVEDMVSCARCGLHLPASESVAEGGRFYCCEAHRSGGAG